MSDSGWGDSWQHDNGRSKDSRPHSEHDHHRWPRSQLIAPLVVGFAMVGYMATLFAFLIIIPIRCGDGENWARANNGSPLPNNIPSARLIGIRSAYLAAVATAFLTLNDVGLIICGITTGTIALQYDQVPSRKLPGWVIAMIGSAALTTGVIGLASGLHW